MVKVLIFILLSMTIMNKTNAASNNLFFTAAQLVTVKVIIYTNKVYVTAI